MCPSWPLCLCDLGPIGVSACLNQGPVVLSWAFVSVTQGLVGRGGVRQCVHASASPGLRLGARCVYGAAIPCRPLSAGHWPLAEPLFAPQVMSSLRSAPLRTWQADSAPLCASSCGGSTHPWSGGLALLALPCSLIVRTCFLPRDFLLERSQPGALGSPGEEGTRGLQPSSSLGILPRAGTT